MTELSLRSMRRKHYLYKGLPLDVKTPHAGFSSLIPFSSVQHLWDEGRLFDIVYDFENSGLDKKDGAILEASGIVMGIDGRPFLMTHIPFRLPIHKTPEPLAPVVAGIYPEEASEGFPAHIGAALFRDFIRDATRIDGAQFGLPLYEGEAKGDEETSVSEIDEEQDEEGQDKKKTPDEYVYTFQFADGPRDVILHGKGEKFRLPGEVAWRKIIATTRPFKGESYDDPYLAYRLAELGHRDIKITQKRQFDVDRLDMWAVLLHLHVFGRKDALRLEAGKAWDAKSQRWLLKTRLADFLAGNSPSAMRERGVENEGIYLMDGRYPDLSRLHGSLEDTLLTVAALQFARRTQPAVMRRLESRLGIDAKRHFLRHGNTIGFVDRPPFGFIDYDRKSYAPFMAMLLSGDDAFGNNSRGVIVNLSHDIAGLEKLSDDDIKRELARQNNPLFKIVDFRQTLLVEDFEAAYEAGVGNDLPPQLYHQRAAFWRTHADLVERIMRADQDLRAKDKPLNVRTIRRLSEDAFSGAVKTLPRYRIRDPRTGQPIFIPPDAYDRAQDKYRRLRTLSDTLLHLAEGHAVEVAQSKDMPDAQAVADYREKVKRSRSSLRQLQRGSDKALSLPEIVDDLSGPEPVVLAVNKPRAGLEPAENVRYIDTAEDACKHLWLSRAAFEHVREEHGLHFTYPEYWVVDKAGRRLEWPSVFISEKPVRFARWLQGGVEENEYTLDIDFAQNPAYFRLVSLLRVFDAEDYNASHGSDAWKKWWKKYVKTYYGDLRPVYDAWCHYAAQGPQNIDPAEHEGMSARKANRLIDKMTREASTSDASEFVRTVMATTEGRAIMQAWRKRNKKAIKNNPLSKEDERILGIDPDTHWPVKRSRFKVDPNKIVILRVPDRMLEYASTDSVWGQFHLVQKPTRAQEKAIAAGAQIVFEGEKLGAWRLATKATVERISEEESESDAYRRGREFSEADYAVHNIRLGGSQTLSRVRFEQIVPIHGWKSANENRQVIPASDTQLAAMLHDEEGGLSRRQEGIIFRDTGERFTKGEAWLRRCVEGKETGDQYKTEILSARCVPVSDLLKLSDKEAERLGGIRSAASLYSLWQRQCSEYLSVNERQDAARQQKV